VSKRNDTWMPLYIGDYLADTSRLSTEQHGAYLLILMDYWRNGPPLDDDEELASITKLPLAQWRKHAAKLRGFFSVEAGRLVQKRADEERGKAGLVSSKRSQAGKAGAASKWGDATDGGAASRSARLAAAREKGKHTKAEWEALQWATGYRCVCCGVGAAELHGGVLTKDHIVPVYQGGSDAIENIQPSCRNCNSRKGDDTTDHRETSSPGWRKRMAERLANAWQTPGPSPSQSNTPPTEDYHHPAGGQAQAGVDVVGAARPTEAGAICRAMRQAGIADTNPGHPRLLSLLQAGATEAEFVGFAPAAIAKGAGFAWILGAVEGERTRAASSAATLQRGPIPSKADARVAANIATAQRFLERTAK
jgi:uncharacterized protein YdaU (DUF1376 family)